jgi:invasion protein IalB
MRQFSPLWAPLFAIVCAVMFAAGAAAQERTTATYDNWVVQCETVPGPPSRKSCEMAQVAQVQGRNTPFSRVAIEQPVRGKPVKLLVQVPVNVLAQSDVHIQIGATDQGLTGPFDHCLPVGCFAEFDLSEDTVRRLRAASGTGKVTYKIANGREISIPLSFKGFDQAYAALVKE